MALLLATVAAFLLVPASAAFAGIEHNRVKAIGHIEIAGAAGAVVGEPENSLQGTPQIVCAWDGTKYLTAAPAYLEGHWGVKAGDPTNCEGEAGENEEEGIIGLVVEGVPAPGSEWAYPPAGYSKTP